MTAGYDRAVYLSPLWEGNRVVDESILFAGGDDRAPLLFLPEKVEALRSPDLLLTYTEGVDYIVEGRFIRRLPEGRIPCFTEEEFYPKEQEPVPAGRRHYPCSIDGRPFIMLAERDAILRRTVHVTYTHRGNDILPVPPTHPEAFARFFARAAAGEEQTVLFFGDSITTGLQSSGKVEAPPYVDPWCRLVYDEIGRRLPNGRFSYVNTAVAGRDTVWGCETFAENVLAYRPELLILAFGMNDGDLSPDAFAANIRRMVDRYFAACPEGAVLLVSTMLPNGEVLGWWRNQNKQENDLRALAATDPDRIALAPLTSLHRAAMTRKNYRDMSGNNANHPNDFLARLYAQCILRTVFG